MPYLLCVFIIIMKGWLLMLRGKLFILLNFIKACMMVMQISLKSLGFHSYPRMLFQILQLNISSNTYTEMYTRITAVPLYHLKNKSQVLVSEIDDNPRNEIVGDEDQSLSIATGTDLADCRILKLKAILIRALMWYYVHKAVSSLSSTATINLYAFPFIASMASNLFDDLSSEDLSEEWSLCEKRLHDVLSSWNLVRCETSSNEGCLFGSIACNLKFQAGRKMELVAAVSH